MHSTTLRCPLAARDDPELSRVTGKDIRSEPTKGKEQLLYHKVSPQYRNDLTLRIPGW